MLAYERVGCELFAVIGPAEHRNWIFELISDSCWSTLSLIRVCNNLVQESFNELWVVMSSLCFITVEFNCCFRCVHAVFWERVMCFILLDGTGWMLDEYSMKLDECSMNAPKTRWMLDDCSMNGSCQLDLLEMIRSQFDLWLEGPAGTRPSKDPWHKRFDYRGGV